MNIPIGGFFKIFEFRGGISKYHHDELAADGTIGTSFFSNGGEMRADVVQTERGGWGGTTGVQDVTQDAKIAVTRNTFLTAASGISASSHCKLWSRDRYVSKAASGSSSPASMPTRTPIIAANGGAVGATALARTFTPISASVGANYEAIKDWRVGLSVSHSERAPAIDELFSNGAHGGSQQFLVGDPDLSVEKSNGAELSVHRTTGPVHVQASIYYSRYSNFIFQAPTGVIREGLPDYDYRQGKADYYGFEVESDAKFGKALGIDWGGELVADAVRAKIKNFGNAPEIPPFRVLGGLTGSRGQVDGRVEVEHVTAQRRTAPIETPTPGYTMVNASFDWHPFAANPELTLSLIGNNLFDVNARRHASDLKDYAPLAGRDIRLSRARELLGKEKEAVRRRGAEPPLGKRIWGDDAFPRGLNVDSGGDRLELAYPFPEVRDLDPAACRRKSAVAGLVGQLEALQLEPSVPGFEPGPARSGETHDDARREHSNRQQVHHFSSCRSASISRASSSFWVLM